MKHLLGMCDSYIKNSKTKVLSLTRSLQIIKLYLNSFEYWHLYVLNWFTLVSLRCQDFATPSVAVDCLTCQHNDSGECCFAAGRQLSEISKPCQCHCCLLSAVISACIPPLTVTRLHIGLVACRCLPPTAGTSVWQVDRPTVEHARWSMQTMCSGPSIIVICCNYIMHFMLLAGYLSRTCSYVLIDVDNGLCSLLNEHCWVTITRAVFGKQYPERLLRTL